MSAGTAPPGAGRERVALNRERIVAAGVALADDAGIARLSMRRLGEALGVEAMSLYHHVANKEDLLDGMIDVVFAEVGNPSAGAPWRPEMRARAAAVRRSMSRHRWAVGLMDSRPTPGPATLAHHEAVLACLRAAGFSWRLAGHAFSLMDSYVYGFVLQEQSLPFRTPEEAAEMTPEIMAGLPAERYPTLYRFAHVRVMQPGYDFGEEFEIGLDLVLDSLERAHAAGVGADA